MAYFEKSARLQEGRQQTLRVIPSVPSDMVSEQVHNSTTFYKTTPNHKLDLSTYVQDNPDMIAVPPDLVAVREHGA